MAKGMTDEEIVKCYQGGVSVAALAEHLNTSRGHIYNCMKRHNKPDEFYKKQEEYELRTNRKYWYDFKRKKK